MSERTILGIIPARGGSKRLRGKNIRLLLGKPLISWTIEVAQNTKMLDKYIVSTDDEEIREVSLEYGAEVLSRPKELAGDNTSTMDVVLHVLKELDYKADVVVLLQPTSPLRTVDDINKCITLYNKSDFDSVVSVYEISPHTFYPNGAVYVFKDKIWSDNMGMVLMSKEKSVDIDTELDFWLAEQILKKRNINLDKTTC